MVIWITKHLLDKKQQLSRIWLAAHWEKKLKRAQIYEVDIEKSVQDILDAEIVLDLRISGHLLVGIVKIHSRKTKYLLTECNNIFYQVKIFRTGGIDLPDDKQTAAISDITLNEFMDNFVSIQNDVIDSIFTANQINIDEITLKETTGMLTLVDDDDLRDFVFHQEDEPMIFDDDFLNDEEEIAQANKPDATLKLNEENEVCNFENQTDFNLRCGETDIGFHEEAILDEFPLNPEEDMAQGEIVDLLPQETSNTKKQKKSVSVDKVYISGAWEKSSGTKINFLGDNHLCNNQDSISKDLNNGENSDNLLLEPVKKTVLGNHSSKFKKIKKKKVCVDYIKAMSYETLKKQVLDTSDITSIPFLAPSTKGLMILKETGNVEQLFKMPVLRFGNSNLLKLYQRNLKTSKCNDETEISSESGDSFEVWEGFEPESFKKCVEPKTVQEQVEPEIISNDEFNRENMIDNLQDLDENVMPDAETENLGIEQVREEEFDQCVPQNDIPLNYKEQKSYSNDFQSTQASKTSEDKRAYALQGKIIQLLQSLKLLFEKNSVICFSSLVQNKPKSWVAQQFLCILMLKKYEVIALDQSEPFTEIFISPEMNFDGACSKFCNF